jgi:hypothetical protein
MKNLGRAAFSPGREGAAPFHCRFGRGFGLLAASCTCLALAKISIAHFMNAGIQLFFDDGNRLIFTD